MQKIFTIENFLSEEECFDLITNIKKEYTLTQATVAGTTNSEGISDVRKSSITFLPNIESIDEKLKSTLRDNIKLNGFEATKLNPYQFTEYKVGEYYEWHTDSSETIYTERFCSIVIQLNDSYEGGELEITDKDIIKIKKKTGTLCVFYSSMLHRVTSVTSGTRYSLVNWVCLDKLKNYKKTLI